MTLCYNHEIYFSVNYFKDRRCEKLPCQEEFTLIIMIALFYYYFATLIPNGGVWFLLRRRINPHTPTPQTHTTHTHTPPRSDYVMINFYYFSIVRKNNIKTNKWEKNINDRKIRDAKEIKNNIRNHYVMKIWKQKILMWFPFKPCSQN